MANAVSRCEHCGQHDDHPKVHFNTGRTVHHDCLSADERADVVGSAEHAEAIVVAAESGTHGDDLRAHIVGLHNGQAAE